MSMQVSRATVSQVPAVAAGMARVHERHDAYRDLSKALKSDDIGGAREAYADILRNAPPGATWNAGGTIAQLGQALVAGDVSGAKAVLESAAKNRAQQGGPVDPISLPAPVPTKSSTGGTAGSTISVVA